MKTFLIYTLALLAALSGLSHADIAMAAGGDFRGIPLGPANFGNTLRTEWWIDQEDPFFGHTAFLPIVGTKVNGISRGLVAPYENDPNTGNPVPLGPLTGDALAVSGRWMGSSDYLYNGVGSVFRNSSNDDTQVVCLPWRITPGLGDQYLIASDVLIAAGESFRMSFMGDFGTFGNADGLMNGGFGQLTAEFTRGTGAQSGFVFTTVAWHDEVNGVQTVTTNFNSAENDILNLQLGWSDVADDFDLVLGDGFGPGLDRPILSGQLMNPIDVFGIGFQLSGPNSEVSNFLAAVPEPSTYALMGIGLVGLIGVGYRQRRQLQAAA